MSEITPLRIFVAMPGTDLGANASYKKPESIKNNLLKPVAEKLETKLGRKVELVIEKDKIKPGGIHASMFAEARNADVYIADLTGANPNVYLELGVRWALRDYVTILITQSIEDLKFNVSASKAILYYPDNIIDAINDIVTAILDGLNNKNCDSAVRLNNEFVTISKHDLDNLQAEIEKLKTTHGRDLLRAAQATDQLSDRLLMLKQAVNINPSCVEALLELGKTYQGLSQYDEAVNILQSVKRLDPNNVASHRELGICYGKLGKLELAAEFLSEAVRLAPNDLEAWSSLGGALRRLGMVNAPSSYNQKALEEARSSYQQAYMLDKFNLYAALNVSRLDLLLSKWKLELLEQAKEGFQKQLFLCRHLVAENPKDYWRQFDLAEILMFSGEYEESYNTFTKAVETIPKDGRKDKILSVLGPLRDYLAAGVIDEPIKVELRKVFALLESTQ